MPQKNKCVPDDTLISLVSQFENDKWKMASVGNTDSAETEMRKYDNPRPYSECEDRLKDPVSDQAVFEVATLLFQQLDMDCVTTFESVLLSLKEDGAGGIGFRGNKGDLIDKYAYFTWLIIKYPFWAAVTFPTLWATLQKEEVRLKEKNTRTFQFPNAIFHVLTALCSQRFNNDMKKNWKKIPFCSGFSPQNDLEDLFYRWHKNQGIIRLLVTWDGVNFDRSLPTNIMILVKKVRQLHARVCSGMTKDEALKRECLKNADLIGLIYEMIITRVHVMADGSAYFTTGGNPSGSHNTTFDNCIAHLLIFYFMWRKHISLFPDDVASDFQTFVRDIGLSFYGDDGAACSPTIGYDNFWTHVPTYWKEITDRGCLLETHKDLSTFVFLGLKYFQYGGKFYFYGADPSKQAFSLLKGGSLDTLDNIQATRIYGQWQVSCFLLLLDQPTCKEMEPTFKYFHKLDQYLVDKVREGTVTGRVAESFKETRTKILALKVYTFY